MPSPALLADLAMFQHDWSHLTKAFIRIFLYWISHSLFFSREMSDQRLLHFDWPKALTPFAIPSKWFAMLWYCILDYFQNPWVCNVNGPPTVTLSILAYEWQRSKWHIDSFSRYWWSWKPENWLTLHILGYNLT